MNALYENLIMCICERVIVTKNLPLPRFCPSHSLSLSLSHRLSYTPSLSLSLSHALSLTFQLGLGLGLGLRIELESPISRGDLAPEF
jgi:hypothetical protein